MYFEPLKAFECNGAPVVLYTIQRKEEGRDFADVYSGACVD